MLGGSNIYKINFLYVLVDINCSVLSGLLSASVHFCEVMHCIRLEIKLTKASFVWQFLYIKISTVGPLVL